MGNNRNLWFFGQKTPILKSKDFLIDSYVRYMVNRTLSMFEYKGLPETIPERDLEMIVQLFRFGIITKVEDKLFVFYGGLGGEPNEYYQPTQAIVSNPYLRYSKVLKLDDYIKNDGNAVVMWNDKSHIGLLPMFLRNSELLAECDISLKYSLVKKRFMNIVTADDDETKDSLQDMFENVENGTGFGIIVTKKLLDESSVGKVETGLSNNSTDLKDIIETKQYILGSWYNELGLNANFNMKREAINESESDMNEDALLPLIDDMLRCRKLAVEQINEKFGTSISVELSSSWKNIRKEIEQREEIVNAEIEQVEEQETLPEEEKNEDATTEDKNE